MYATQSSYSRALSALHKKMIHSKLSFITLPFFTI
nr:MAG TPA: hypothetical protein [Bacteriophage sp.]